MIRTQISIAASEYRQAKREAKRLGISFAELVRRSLRELLPLDRKRPWMKYCGLVASGNKDSSLGIDELVYGRKD
jgi:hypothetical protein